jgi:hypothetical protein
MSGDPWFSASFRKHKLTNSTVNALDIKFEEPESLNFNEQFSNKARRLAAMIESARFISEFFITSEFVEDQWGGLAGVYVSHLGAPPWSVSRG